VHTFLHNDLFCWIISKGEKHVQIIICVISSGYTYIHKYSMASLRSQCDASPSAIALGVFVVNLFQNGSPSDREGRQKMLRESLIHKSRPIERVSKLNGQQPVRPYFA